MKQSVFTILENAPVSRRYTRLRLRGDLSEIRAPGQFVNLRLDGFFLRRPLSVCDAEDGVLTLIYEAVGRGTSFLQTLSAGAELELLTGLGNGFDCSRSGDFPLLVGGGSGVSPLYGLAKALRAEGKAVSAVLGFGCADEVYGEEAFRALGAEVTVCTEDGSRGCRGFVTAAMDRPFSFFYACGPDAMLRAVSEKAACSGQLSFAEHMGCGFGACMGCTHRTRSGGKRICRDGPVLDKEDILWDD